MYLLQKIEPLYSITHLVNVAYYQLPENYTSPGESHDFWECVYVDKGAIVVKAGNMEYLLKAGELAFHCPMEYHNVLIYDNKPASIVVIAFCCNSESMKAFEHRILFLGQQEKQCMRTIVKEAEASYQYFENLAPNVKLEKKDTAPFGTEQFICASLEQLFIYIRRRDKSIRFDSRGIPDHLRHHAELIQAAQAYMAEHLSEKITLVGLASELNVSVSQLKRIFKSQTSTSVIAYLTDLRINTAKRLIREQNLNFTQIAEAVGYDSIYYFSAQFKRQTGMTPTEYSRSVRQ